MTREDCPGCNSVPGGRLCLIHDLPFRYPEHEYRKENDDWMKAETRVAIGTIMARMDRRERVDK